MFLNISLYPNTRYISVFLQFCINIMVVGCFPLLHSEFISAYLAQFSILPEESFAGIMSCARICYPQASYCITLARLSIFGRTVFSHTPLQHQQSTVYYCYANICPVQSDPMQSVKSKNIPSLRVITITVGNGPSEPFHLQLVVYMVRIYKGLHILPRSYHQLTKYYANNLFSNEPLQLTDSKGYIG